MFKFAISTILLIVLFPYHLLAEDFYKLLGVEKNADQKEIRRAFKKIAVTKHPDKNIDDPEAHANFIKIAEAYEILKDPSKRSDYDLYGADKFKNQAKPQYHSYTYYRDVFGIYDDDPLIETLSGDDFESSVEGSTWFINFYSPLCSHCHHLAPSWRLLSKLLEGVVKIGAVNCQDDRQLCWDLNIQQYPTLLYYNEKATMHDKHEYYGSKTPEAMEEFALSQLSKLLEIPKLNELPDPVKSPWLLFLCASDSLCPNENTRIKSASVLKDLVSIGYTDNETLIHLINGDTSSHVLFWDRKDSEVVIVEDIDDGDFIEIADRVLHLLPEATEVNEGRFQNIRSELRSGETTPWLLCFTMGLDTETTVMLKKLRASLDKFNIGEVNCGRNSGLCASLHIVKYPTWAILKKGGAFEVLYGRSSLLAVEKFAKETQSATNLHALSPQDLQRIMAEGTPWIIGWLLTGCPPCKRMLPALRKASNHFTPEVIQFGTVDCAQHSHVCSQYNVRSYPTTIIYNASNVITFQGESNEQAIIEFISMMKTNYVKTLTIDNFYTEVGNKNELDIYVVEFYAPWCGPCIKLQPEWRKMAHKLSHLKRVHVGAVNCVDEYDVCNAQGVTSYPTIRLYPSGSHGLNTMAVYPSYERDSVSLHKWVLNFVPSSIKILTDGNYKNNLLSNREDRTWVVMFYAPWCGFCHKFEPDFVTVMQKLENIVIGGKVDCQRQGALCQREGISEYPTVKVFQREDGVTKLNGITIDSVTQEGLYAEIKPLVANSYITPLDHDEL